QVALHALGGFDGPTQIEHALDRALKAEGDRDDLRVVIGSAMMRRTARMPAEAWMMKHWDEVAAKLPGHLALGPLRALGFGCTSKEADEIASFYAPKAQAIEGGERSINEAQEEAKLCVALRRKM